MVGHHGLILCPISVIQECSRPNPAVLVLIRNIYLPKVFLSHEEAVLYIEAVWSLWQTSEALLRNRGVCQPSWLTCLPFVFALESSPDLHLLCNILNSAQGPLEAKGRSLISLSRLSSELPGVGQFHKFDHSHLPGSSDPMIPNSSGCV